MTTVFDVFMVWAAGAAVGLGAGFIWSYPSLQNKVRELEAALTQRRRAGDSPC